MSYIASEAHYRTLGVTRSSSQDEIRSAFKRLALQYHPDKNASPDAAEQFLKIKQAADHLLKLPPAARAYQPTMTPTNAYCGAPNGNDNPYYANPCYDNPWARRSFYKKKEEEEKETEYPKERHRFEASPSESSSSEEEGYWGSNWRSTFNKDEANKTAGKKVKQMPPRKHIVSMTLEELIADNWKTFKVYRMVMDKEGKSVREKVHLSAYISRPDQIGMKVVFPSEGDRKPGYEHGDIHLIVQLAPHRHFRQLKACPTDLLYEPLITYELLAKSSWCLSIPTLDGATIRECIGNVAAEFRIKGRGLYCDESKRRGDIIVRPVWKKTDSPVKKATPTSPAGGGKSKKVNIDLSALYSMKDSAVVDTSGVDEAQFQGAFEVIEDDHDLGLEN